MEKKNIETVDVDMLLRKISTDDDKQAFRQLFDCYYPALCLYAKRFIEEKETREDIVQDVFFSIWENRKHISIQTSSRSYLTTCVRNHCLNFIQRNRMDTLDMSVPENIPLYAENHTDLYLLNELETLLAQALAKLPEDYRRVFELNRFEDKSYAEIAENMHISTRTVERYKNKAIEILKKDLKDYLPLLAGWMV